MNNEFEETINKLKTYISSVDSIYFLGPRKENVGNLICKMEEDCNKKINDEEVESEIIIKDVTSILDYILAVYLELPISNETSTFISTLCLLIMNWNSNINIPEEETTKEIFIKVKLADRIYKNHLTSFELFNYMRNLIYRAKQMENYALPSLELSKHYLETFDT
jgi:hypothetical protein